MDESQLVLAGRPIPNPETRLRRYCGLAWDGGPPEVWAWPYYDAIPTDPDRLDAVDVMVCGALHPGLSRSDLEFFVEQRSFVNDLLAALPTGCDLADADADAVRAVINISGVVGVVSLSLLSKVLHRKRPRLVPLMDRGIIDWYRPVTGSRGPAAWAPLVEQLQADLSELSNRLVLDVIRGRVAPELDGNAPSNLRIADIAIWMGQ